MCPLVRALDSWVRGVFWFEDMPFGGLEILHPEPGDLFLKDVNTESQLKEGNHELTHICWKRALSSALLTLRPTAFKNSSFEALCLTGVGIVLGCWLRKV